MPTPYGLRGFAIKPIQAQNTSNAGDSRSVHSESARRVAFRFFLKSRNDEDPNPKLATCARRTQKVKSEATSNTAPNTATRQQQAQYGQHARYSSRHRQEALSRRPWSCFRDVASDAHPGLAPPTPGVTAYGLTDGSLTDGRRSLVFIVVQSGLCLHGELLVKCKLASENLLVN